MSNLQPGGNPASHWIKEVVEEVAPKGGSTQATFLNTPSTVQPTYSTSTTGYTPGLWTGQSTTSVPALGTPAVARSMTNVNPAYMAYYQDYYARMYQANGASVSAASTNTLR
ncbi:hypothetical protein EON65_55410 [archaeon]|nr:MAG: hypothetical protein EON65_55410 [archaeon]